ncbi:hypothetical protein [Natronomonas marina]|jgi:tetratricopeptide (TPR) repeat protein|uniref:hypothetical protein n=1 Tax=Natronomonas marina TaxID=2961939 RepID=UPI0020C9605D|nr:hypothetical protein [Natronomonas marina]
MKRRALLSSAAVGVAGIAGCAGPGDERTPTSTAGDPVQTAAARFQTAIDEFDRYTGSLQQTRLDYSSETVTIALEEGRAALETARDSNPTDRQQAQIEYLATVADAIEATAKGYGALVSLSDHLGLAESYVDASRREDAVAELDAATDDLDTARTRLDTGIGDVRSAREMDVALETDLTLVEWRQRLVQSVDTLDAVKAAIAGYEHETTGRLRYDDGVGRVDSEDYEEAVAAFEEAFQSFGRALEDYDTAEQRATDSYKQQLIQRRCRIEGYRTAAELAFDGAKLYDEGAFDAADEKFVEAREALNRDC